GEGRQAAYAARVRAGRLLRREAFGELREASIEDHDSGVSRIRRGENACRPAVVLRARDVFMKPALQSNPRLNFAGAPVSGLDWDSDDGATAFDASPFAL